MQKGVNILNELDEFFVIDEETCTLRCLAPECNFSVRGSNILQHVEAHLVHGRLDRVEENDRQVAYGPARIDGNVRRRRNNGNAGIGSRHTQRSTEDHGVMGEGSEIANETLIGMTFILAARQNELRRNVKHAFVAFFCCAIMLFIWAIMPEINPLRGLF